jgi:diacylglycerol kinase (ATP)
MESLPNSYQPIPVKLIFNSSAGAVDESPVQLLDVINELQNWRMVPEAYLFEPNCDLTAIVSDALERDIRMFVVCGGDGTIESVAEALIDKDAVLGIIPTGTRNNVALSLGIPKEITKAVSLLRAGRPTKIDVGSASCGKLSRIFLETCSIGLFSALYPAAEDLRLGNLGGLGDFLAALITSPLAKIRLSMDSLPEKSLQGHVAFVSNLPYVGPNFPIASKVLIDDGLLDVLVFNDQSKLEILANMIQMAGEGWEEPDIERYQVKRVEITTDPPLPVMTDGFALGEGSVKISVQQCALTIMAAEAVS